MFFKKLNNKSKRPTGAELKSLVKYYNHMTADMSDSEAMEMLDSLERFHYLMLLKIADYAPMGKTKAIIYAFKMGYLYAKGRIGLGVPEHYQKKDRNR